MSYNCDPAFTAVGQHTETLRLGNEKFLERGSVLGGAAFHRPLPPARRGGLRRRRAGRVRRDGAAGAPMRNAASRVLPSHACGALSIT